MAYLTLSLDLPQDYLVGRRIAETRERALDLIIDDRCRSLGVLVELRAPAALWTAIRQELQLAWFADDRFVAIMQRYRFDLRLHDTDGVREDVRIPIPADAPSR